MNSRLSAAQKLDGMALFFNKEQRGFGRSKMAGFSRVAL